MRLTLAQINPTIGDIAGNAALIAAWTAKARAQHADLVVFPELTLTGYPPKDLLLQEGFIDACVAAAKSLGENHSAGLTLIFGVPLPLETGGVTAAKHKHLLGNSLLAYRDGKLLAYYDKRLLPTYDVFDENRYFFPGREPVIIDVKGVAVGLSICEDLWRGQDVGFADRYFGDADPVNELIKAGAKLIINPSASPFRLGLGARHRDLLRAHALKHKVHIAAVNQVGGNDELIFDGSACCFAPDGHLLTTGPSFQEALTTINVRPLGATMGGHTLVSAELVVSESGGGIDPDDVGITIVNTGDQLTTMPQEEALFKALTLGVRDYLRKTGFSSAVLGLSGGIDSAVVAVLAAAALGPQNVHTVSLPSRYSSSGSLTDAVDLAKRLNLAHQSISIEEGFKAMERTLAPAFTGKAPDTAEENIQSRLRGLILMALSNKFGHLLLTTGNKSEMAVGYATLYGDMNGGLAVISDVAKTLVYRLAKWINANWQSLSIPGLTGPPIPESSLTKAPSAELRPNQTDQDSLPPYDVIDEIVERYVEQRHSLARITADMTAADFSPHTDAATVARVIRLIDRSEFKRKQAAPGLKVTSVAFGSGRRIPIAQKWRP